MVDKPLYVILPWSDDIGKSPPIIFSKCPKLMLLSASDQPKLFFAWGYVFPHTVLLLSGGDFRKHELILSQEN